MYSRSGKAASGHCQRASACSCSQVTVGGFALRGVSKAIEGDGLTRSKLQVEGMLYSYVRGQLYWQQDASFDSDLEGDQPKASALQAQFAKV